MKKFATILFVTHHVLSMDSMGQVSIMRELAQAGAPVYSTITPELREGWRGSRREEIELVRHTTMAEAALLEQILVAYAVRGVKVSWKAKRVGGVIKPYGLCLTMKDKAFAHLQAVCGLHIKGL